MSKSTTPACDAAQFEAIYGALRRECIPLKLGRSLESRLTRINQLVTTDHETKESFIGRVKAVLEENI